MSDVNTYYNVELPKKEAEELKDFLREIGVYFEASSADNLIHFEIYMSDSEYETVNDFLIERYIFFPSLNS